MLSPISSDLWVWMVGDAAIQLPQGFWWSGNMFLPARKWLCSFYLAMSNSSALLLWFNAFRGHFWPASCPTGANGIGGLMYFPLRWVRSGSCFKGMSLCSGEFMPFFLPLVPWGWVVWIPKVARQHQALGLAVGWRCLSTSRVGAPFGQPLLADRVTFVVWGYCFSDLCF